MIKKYKNKVINLSLTFLMIFSTFLSNLSIVNADTYVPIDLGTIASTGAAVKQGYNTAYWYSGIGKIMVDGEIAFCIGYN